MSYRDVIGKRSRTWPYGTQKQVTVIHVEEPQKRFIICVDEMRAGYVLIFTDGDKAQVNDKGIITFTQGGPLGGYWKFTKESS